MIYLRSYSALVFASVVLASCAATTPALAPSPTAAPTATLAPSPTVQPTTAPPAPSAGWWNERVFYEIFVRSFADSNGDGKGDFNGITDKLDYLSSLGIGGIWLMPIQPASSYHGYDVTDYLAVNPDYGTLDDLKQFLAEAHQRDIKVLMDFVINHTSDKHPWFIASQDPKSDKRSWYVWSDSKPNVVGPGGAEVWHRDSSGYYYGFFTTGMPDLNYRHPDVTGQMDEAARFWLQEVGMDGFRIDAAPYLIEDGKTLANTPETHAWFGQFHAFMTSVRPEAMTIGEVWDNIFAAVPYVQNGEMNLVFNFDLASSYVAGVNGRNGRKISDALAFNPGKYPLNQFGSFLTNHDMSRVLSQFGGDMSKMKAAAVIYLTGPGVPFIYYGEEIGMTGSKPDENIRKPMQWSPGDNAGFTTGAPWITMTADYQGQNVATESADPDSLLSLYRKLVGLRTQHPSLRNGDTFKMTASPNEVFATLRASRDEAIMVLLNLGDAPVQDYKISLDGSALKGRYTLEPLLGEGQFAAVTVDERGGFAGFQPSPELQPGTRLILLLKPIS